MSKNSEEGRKVSTIAGITLIATITVILAAVISAFVFGMAGNLGRNPLEINILEQNDNQIIVEAVYQLNNEPLPNVGIGIYSYGTQNLLEGPIQSNDSGRVLLKVPNGYDHFDVIGKYNGSQTIRTFDNRPIFLRIQDFFGPSLYVVILGSIVGIVTCIIAYVKRKKFLEPIWEKVFRIENENNELWRR